MDLVQQVLAVDSKFNKYRSNPAARQVYLKRRVQLLERSEVKEEVRRETGYLQARTLLLRQLVRSQGLSDLQSTKSFSVSTGETRARLSQLPTSGSQVSSEAYDFRGFHHLSDLHTGAVTHLMFAHNSSTSLLASSLDGLMSVHNLDTNPPTVTTLAGHSAGVTDFDISTNSEVVVSSSLDNTVCLWQLSTAVMIRQMKSSSKVGLTSVRFLPGNNNLVVTGSRAGLVQIINISTGIFPTSGTSTLPGSVLCLAVSSQDDLVWAGTDRGAVFSFRVDTNLGKLSKGHRHLVAEGRKVTSIVTRPTNTNTNILVNVGNNSLLLYTVTDSLGSLSLYRTFSVVHSELNLRSSFAPLMSYRSGECVVSGSEDGGVYFFDVSRTNKSCINKLQAHSAPALAVAFNYNETFLATSDNSGLVIVWKR